MNPADPAQSGQAAVSAAAAAENPSSPTRANTTGSQAPPQVNPNAAANLLPSLLLAINGLMSPTNQFAAPLMYPGAFPQVPVNPYAAAQYPVMQQYNPNPRTPAQVPTGGQYGEFIDPNEMQQQQQQQRKFMMMNVEVAHLL